MEDNVVEFTGEWQGSDESNDMTEDEARIAMDELLAEVDLDRMNLIVSNVLEYLTYRAVNDTAYYIMTDDRSAMALFAAGDDAKTLISILPDTVKCMNDEYEDDFITNSDPGDEQNESATESE